METKRPCVKTEPERFSLWSRTGTESVALELGLVASVRTARALESYEKSSRQRTSYGCDVAADDDSTCVP
jgi:hypothetical protein